MYYHSKVIRPHCRRPEAWRATWTLTWICASLCARTAERHSITGRTWQIIESGSTSSPPKCKWNRLCLPSSCTFCCQEETSKFMVCYYTRCCDVEWHWNWKYKNFHPTAYGMEFTFFTSIPKELFSLFISAVSFVHRSLRTGSSFASMLISCTRTWPTYVTMVTVILKLFAKMTLDVMFKM